MHPTKRENITNRSITHPKNNLNQLIQNQEAESARLTEKLRHIEFAIGQQRSQNQQLTDTLNLYINNESDMLKVTTKLNHDKQLMINERADILRKIENGKSVQYEVINQLRSARDEQQELCNIQMQKTDHN
jgi:O6-methylguanine-DNA--protein-cysteine methyltransferase